MHVQQSTAHNTAETHKAAHQHYTHKGTSRYTNTHKAKPLLGTLTSLCHRTVTTVEHKSHSCLHCSNTLGNTNSYLCVRTLAALTVCTYAKTPTLSPLSWFGFFELWWVFLPKPHKHLLNIKGTNTQHISPPTKDLVIK